MPKIKVKGQRVKTGERPQTNGRTHTDATKRIISPATWSVKKWKSASKDWSVCWQSALQSRPHHGILSTEEDQWGMEKCVEFCTPAAIISASNSSHVALSQHLLS